MEKLNDVNVLASGDRRKRFRLSLCFSISNVLVKLLKHSMGMKLGPKSLSFQKKLAKITTC